MIFAIIAILFVLWLLGFISVGFLNIPLFSFGGETVTVLDLLIFLVVLWAIGILPSPFRQIGIVLALLWVLSVFGIIAIANFSTIIMLAFIAGLIIYAVQSIGHRHI